MADDLKTRRAKRRAGQSTNRDQAAAGKVSGAMAEPALPGEPDAASALARIIRVNHAGEYGAANIYAGQIAILGDDPETGPLLKHMKEQEAVHLEYFEKELVRRRIRPSALTPVWSTGGFALGAVTALMGRRAAMACTVAVEEVIEEHYQSQLDRLGPDEARLREAIARFQAEEVEHRDTGLDEGAEDTPGYAILSRIIKTGSRAAIWLAQRV